jgi:hypothetical protein
MTYTPIPTGTANWDAPLNAALTTLDATVTSNGSRLTALEVTPTTKTGAAAGSVAYAGLVTGDTFDRYRVYADGKLEWGTGVAPRDVNLYRSGGNLQTDSYFVMATSGQATGTFSVFTGTAKALIVGTAGGGLAVKEGTSARMGTLVLTGATPVVVANTSVSALTRILLTTNTPGGTPGFCWVSARTAGTSFSVTGTAGDTSTVAYLLIEPA